MSGIADPPLPFTGGRTPASETERAFVARRVLLQFAVAPAVSFAGVLIGFNLGWPRLTAAGVIGFGLTALCIGALAIRERRLMFIRGSTLTRPEYRYVIYEGLAAVPYGLAYVMGGVCLIGLALLFLSGTSLERMRQLTLARPSLGLIPVGAVLLSYGLAFIVGFVDRSGSPWRRAFSTLLDAPARLGGFILVAWATAMLVIGSIEWMNRALFDRWFESITGNRWPFGIP